MNYHAVAQHRGAADDTEVLSDEEPAARRVIAGEHFRAISEPSQGCAIFQWERSRDPVPAAESSQRAGHTCLSERVNDTEGRFPEYITHDSLRSLFRNRHRQHRDGGVLLYTRDTIGEIIPPLAGD